jgi:hypothetical protein
MNKPPPSDSDEVIKRGLRACFEIWKQADDELKRGLADMAEAERIARAGDPYRAAILHQDAMQTIITSSGIKGSQAHHIISTLARRPDLQPFAVSERQKIFGGDAPQASFEDLNEAIGAAEIERRFQAGQLPGFKRGPKQGPIERGNAIDLLDRFNVNATATGLLKWAQNEFGKDPPGHSTLRRWIDHWLDKKKPQ